jgi:hypothetical protein
MLPQQSERAAWIDGLQVAQTAAAILGTAPQHSEGTADEARAAGVQARARSADRVPAPYRSWDLQRAFIAGWLEADAKTGKETR